MSYLPLPGKGPPQLAPLAESQSSKRRKSVTHVHKNSSRPSKTTRIEPDEEDDATLEDRYHAALPTAAVVSSAADDTTDDVSLPQHETVSGGSNKKLKHKRKVYIKEDEPKEERDRRTIFVGNLPVEILKSKVGGKRVHSLRVAVTNFDHRRLEPSSLYDTSQLSSRAARSRLFDSALSRSKSLPRNYPTTTIQSLRQLRGDNENLNALGGGKGEHDQDSHQKTYLTANEKKRIAFIRKEIHAEAGSVNAYIVFAHVDPNQTTDDIPAMDPFDAAELAVTECDGTTFMGRVLRVDHASKSTRSSLNGDPKLAIFVGNLDFESQEQALREFFDELIRKEFPDVASEEDRVKHVRIIRDPGTQMGKGFGYVHFTVSEVKQGTCFIFSYAQPSQARHIVDGLLALDAAKLKFAKRNLRIQKCKTLPSGKITKRNEPTGIASRMKQARSRDTEARNTLVAAVPRGDPTLGERLRTLSKEERKEAKAGDSSRVARRLAKKLRKSGQGRRGES